MQSIAFTFSTNAQLGRCAPKRGKTRQKRPLFGYPLITRFYRPCLACCHARQGARSAAAGQRVTLPPRCRSRCRSIHAGAARCPPVPPASTLRASSGSGGSQSRKRESPPSCVRRAGLKAAPPASDRPVRLPRQPRAEASRRSKEINRRCSRGTPTSAADRRRPLGCCARPAVLTVRQRAGCRVAPSW